MPSDAAGGAGAPPSAQTTVIEPDIALTPFPPGVATLLKNVTVTLCLLVVVLVAYATKQPLAPKIAGGAVLFLVGLWTKSDGVISPVRAGVNYAKKITPRS